MSSGDSSVGSSFAMPAASSLNCSQSRSSDADPETVTSTLKAYEMRKLSRVSERRDSRMRHGSAKSEDGGATRTEPDHAERKGSRSPDGRRASSFAPGTSSAARTMTPAGRRREQTPAGSQSRLSAPMREIDREVSTGTPKRMSRPAPPMPSVPAPTYPTGLNSVQAHL